MATPTPAHEVSFIQGEDVDITIRFYLEDELDAFDLTDVTELKVCFPNADGSFLEKTLADGVEILGIPTNGKAKVTLTKAETALIMVGQKQDIQATLTIDAKDRIVQFIGVMEVKASKC